MTKPKLTDGVKQPSEKLADPTVAPASAADSGKGGAAGQPPVGDKGNADSDKGEGEDPAASAGKPGDNPPENPSPAKAEAKPESAPTANVGGKTLAEYKTAFGDVQGCVYFAEGMDFTTACAKHMEVQGKQIADLKAANETLTTQAKALAKEVGGNAEPLKTGAENAKGGAKSSIDEYASLLESKLAAL